MILLRRSAHAVGWTACVLGLPLMALAAGTAYNTDSSLHAGLYLRQVLPSLAAVALFALAAAWTTGGRHGVQTAGAWILGARNETRAALAARTLAAGSRAALAFGIVASLLTLLTIGSTLAGEHVQAARSGGIAGTLFPPLFALLFGRALLGSLAVKAAVTAGEPPDRSLRGWSDFAVPLLLVLFPTLILLTTVYRYPAIVR